MGGKITNREQCDNCGKFVAKTIGRRYSDNTGMITCLECYDAEVQDEKRASYYEWNWHNDHGDCE